MFGWCGRTGALLKLPSSDGFVRVLLQVVSGGAARRKGGPHHSAVLHGVCGAGVQYRLVLDPTVFRLHAGGCVRHGDHAALTAPVATASYIRESFVSLGVVQKEQKKKKIIRKEVRKQGLRMREL